MYVIDHFICNRSLVVDANNGSSASYLFMWMNLLTAQIVTTTMTIVIITTLIFGGFTNKVLQMYVSCGTRCRMRLCLAIFVNTWST